MKTCTQLAVLTACAAFAIAAPAAACDMHGAGYGSPFGMQWKSYNPTVSTLDPALETATPLPKATKKPSFSSAADRASKKALAKREADKADETPVKKASLDTDR